MRDYRVIRYRSTCEGVLPALPAWKIILYFYFIFLKNLKRKFNYFLRFGECLGGIHMYAYSTV